MEIKIEFAGYKQHDGHYTRRIEWRENEKIKRQRSVKMEKGEGKKIAPGKIFGAEFKTYANDVF